MTIADGIDNAPFDLGKLGIGYRLDKVIFADDEPFVIDSSWLPKRVGDKLMPKLREHFISPLIEAHASFDHFDYLFQASTATEEQAALLKVMAGFPVLRAHYVAIGRNGRPLLVGCSTSRGDRLFYKLQTDTHRAQSKWRNNKQK
jgi:DNA-binding GntR family transcriptional regulator